MIYILVFVTYGWHICIFIWQIYLFCKLNLIFLLYFFNFCNIFHFIFSFFIYSGITSLIDNFWKRLKLQLVFFLDLQLFLDCFSKVFSKWGKGNLARSIIILWCGGKRSFWSLHLKHKGLAEARVELMNKTNMVLQYIFCRF